MRVVGLIAEYNPFHNGHRYHIAKAKELTGADYVVVVTSGNYVQRGTPAVVDKHTRAAMALTCGADLVLEMPVVYSTASANYFAMGAVNLLEQLGVVTHLCFGSECGDINLLRRVAEILCLEPAPFKDVLSDGLKRGLTYPQARQLAVQSVVDMKENMTGDVLLSSEDINSVLLNPNNLLAIEYLIALIKSNSSIKPVTITRNDSGYHSEGTTDNFGSATAVRKLFLDYDADKNYRSSLELAKIIPANAFPTLCNYLEDYCSVYADDFSLILGSMIYGKSVQELTKIFDISEDMALRIKNLQNEFQSFSQYAMLVKSKNYTYTSICRGFLHLILNITGEDMIQYTSDKINYYARVLGFVKSSQSLLSAIKAQSSIPLITKMADYKQILVDSPSGIKMIEHNTRSSQLYRMVVMNKSGKMIDNEFTKNLEIF